MRNRTRYITSVNEHDLLLAIRVNVKMCPIFAVSGDYPSKDEKCFASAGDCGKASVKDCSLCAQRWLNKEGK